MIAPVLSMLAGLIFPGRAWGGFAVKALAIGALALGIAFGALQWRADFRAGIEARVRAEERAKRDAAVIAAWDKASVLLAAKDAEKAKIIAVWSASLKAERDAARALELENTLLQDAAESSGIHGREIR
ncbi:MAG: hypothetical protein VYD64_02365 [Pseudomonadota bacterium]|nr:hypothetical protein [Pseudomonadota bacterium]